ncbi:MAG: AAA family ATPase [Clostridiales bacterium]|nr:AAA family ATPase [Clostridiales bacterium]
MKKIIISLNGEWVLEHRDDEVLPVDALLEKLSAHYDGKIFVSDKSFSSLDIVIDESDAEKLQQSIVSLFRADYGEEKAENVISIAIMDAETKPDEADEAPRKATDATADEKGSNDKPTEKKSEAVETPPEGSDRRLQKVLGEIDALVGGDEYKKLVKEIVKIAPEITRNKAYDVFSYRSYIFAINDGYGLDGFLDKLADLITALGLKKLAQFRPVITEKVPATAQGNESPFDGVRALINKKDDNSRVLCIDISEWLNRTDSREFKEFLRDLEKESNKFVYVFRTPFVDKEVLYKLKFSLNDLLYVHTVSFPPLGKDELREYAKKELARFGFTVSPAAWKFFHRRLTEERSDGKFYGLDTVKKVVMELLYIKQLDNASRRKTVNNISVADMRALCATADTDEKSGFEMLDALVGSAGIRKRIEEIVAHIELSLSTQGVERPCIHMRFVGNPGTGKTTVARIVGKILKEKGVLSVGNFYEYSGRDFCGRYVGETAPKTSAMCRDAYGSVMFIDEAYSLYRGDADSRDYGREALDTLIAEMENHRNDLVVIMAGYTDDMTKLMDGNIGLASRMPYTIEFPNFTRDQLYDIFVSMLKSVKYSADLLPAAKEYFDKLPSALIDAKDFANARFVRNLFERTFAKAAMRCQLQKLNGITLTKDDFERSSLDREFSEVNKKRSRIGFEV